MMPLAPASPAAMAARSLPIAWCVFGVFWFLNALLWVLFVSWTPAVLVESMAGEEQSSLYFWLFLGLGVVCSATACAVAWAFVLADPTGYVVPCGRSQSSRSSADG